MKSFIGVLGGFVVGECTDFNISAQVSILKEVDLKTVSGIQKEVVVGGRIVGVSLIVNDG